MGAILTRVRVPCATRNFSSSQLSVQVDSFTASVQSPCAIACLNICARVKNFKHWQPYIPLSGHTEMLHTLIGTGGAALVAAVPCPGEEIRISRKGQWSTKIRRERLSQQKQEVLLCFLSFFSSDISFLFVC